MCETRSCDLHLHRHVHISRLVKAQPLVTIPSGPPRVRIRTAVPNCPMSLMLTMPTNSASSMASRLLWELASCCDITLHPLQHILESTCASTGLPDQLLSKDHKLEDPRHTFLQFLIAATIYNSTRCSPAILYRVRSDRVRLPLAVGHTPTGHTSLGLTVQVIGTIRFPQPKRRTFIC